jgi:hypothetical protein
MNLGTETSFSVIKGIIVLLDAKKQEAQPQTLKNKKNYDRQTKRPNPVDMTFNFQRHITHISYELRLLEAERKSNYGVFNVVIEFKPFI